MLLRCNHGNSFKHVAEGGIHPKEAAVESNDLLV